MEDKLFRKLFRPGGSIKIDEAFNMVSAVLPGMTRRSLVDRLVEEQGSQHVTSPGSTVNKPRGRIDGVHLVTKDEKLEDATVLICSATRIEYSALTPIMVLPVELGVDDGDILMSAIGFDPTFSLLCNCCVLLLRLLPCIWND